ncbi:hypothetical protein DMUE_2919 [Dictyocoela muelleri]|nr:hypothetical protein DMUE_2919 [Dictyocoela muelleri]
MSNQTKYNIEKINPITTQNKYIESYFMKTDINKSVHENKTSYELKILDLLKSYKNTYPIKIVSVYDNDISVHEMINKNFKDDSKDNSKDKSKDDSFKNDSFKNDYYTFTHCGTIKNIKLYNKHNFNTNKSLSSVINELIPIKKFIKNSLVCLILGDFLTRSEIVSLIDFFINICSCKGVLLLPLSLAVCFSMKVSTGIVLFPNNYFSYIEDNVLVEAKRYLIINNDNKVLNGESLILKETGFIVNDDFDIVDEIRASENNQSKKNLKKSEYCSLHSDVNRNDFSKEDWPRQNTSKNKLSKINSPMDDVKTNFKDNFNDGDFDDEDFNDEDFNFNDEDFNFNNFNNEDFNDNNSIDDKNLNDNKNFNHGLTCTCEENNLDDDNYFIGNFYDVLKEFVNLKSAKRAFNIFLVFEEINNNDIGDENLLYDKKDNKFHEKRVKKDTMNDYVTKQDESYQEIINILGEIKENSKIMFFKRDNSCYGASIFIQLDISNELWITDVEWWNSRIKVLRERVLFYV